MLIPTAYGKVFLKLIINKKTTDKADICLSLLMKIMNSSASAPIGIDYYFLIR